MFLLLYLYFIFFIPVIRGKVVSNSILRSSNITHNNNISSTLSESPLKDSGNTTVTLKTEGGPVVSELPSLSLPSESHSGDLTILDKEVDKSKGKSIVPRKGVKYDSEEDPSPVAAHTKERIDSTKSISNVINDKDKIAHLVQSPVKSTIKPFITSGSENKEKPLSTSQTTSPVVHKKPTVLSSEAISETDRRAQMERAKAEGLSESIVSDQLPSQSVKFEPATRISHPDMVMPIVITMLVVPMFAVLGYMALRRGQEAWNNRHYKRMDFLLDGMYND